MADAHTEPATDRAGLPIRMLRLHVVEGPDAGLCYDATSDVVTVGSARGNDLVLSDPTVSRFHLELACRDGGVSVIDCGSTNGTHVGTTRIERGTIPIGALLTLGHSTLRVIEGSSGASELYEKEALFGFVGRTPVVRRLMSQLERAAKSDVSVLLVGESGTGKELAARALHDASERAKAPFVVVDCGSLATELVTSELFGHEKGAFTGADRTHEGAFERADGGTIFLDEAGELSPTLQPMLLGALERRRFRRLGGRSDIVVNVRVIAATNRDLRGAVNSGAFRLDLYHRLSVVTLRLPALRERLDDLPLLVAHLLRDAPDGPTRARLQSPQTLAALAQHAWPGNVRELRNFLDAATALDELPALGGDVGATSTTASSPPSTTANEPYGEARRRVLQDFERAYLTSLLARTGGNVSRASREAQMDRSHLIELLQRHGLR